jgi:hypothetical protein
MKIYFMQGYGFSLWLVPANWREIKEQYGMNHIPHITVCTNMENIDSKILTDEIFMVKDFSNLKKFPKMYTNDPLIAMGFYCKINDLWTNHTPHMTLIYDHNHIIQFNPPDTLSCSLFFADTRSSNCEDWVLL